MTHKRKSGKKKKKTDKGRTVKALPIPACITAESLEERLMCSDQRKRMLTKLLHKAHPEGWPETVESSEFYNVLHHFVQLPNGRDSFNAVARKVEKKNRPVNFPEALYKHLTAKHGSSEELDQIYKDLLKSKEGFTKLFRWVTENDSAEEAVHTVWAWFPHRSNKIQSVIDEIKELDCLLAPFAGFLAEREASEKTRATQSSKPKKIAEASSNRADVQDDSISTVLSKLQEAVLGLTADSISDEQIQVISDLANGLSIAHTENSNREAINTSISLVIEDASSALKDAGHRAPDEELDIPSLIEKLSEDDIANMSSVTDSLNVTNEQIGQLQQLFQENVSAEHLVSMTDAVQVRDQLCQELIHIFEDDPATDEKEAVSDEPEIYSPVAAPELVSSGENVEVQSVDENPVDPPPPEKVDSGQAAEAEVEVEVRSNDAHPSLETHESPDTGPQEASPADIVKTEEPCESVESRLESYAIAGEVSKCYWLTWTNAALGIPGEISTVALQCVAAAGELQPDVPPSVTLRRGLSEVAKEDFNNFENRVLGIAALIPTALFCQQKPTGLYTLANQLRSSAGESSLDEIFDETVKACVDQGIWISNSAISSVAVRSGKSERAQEVVKNAEQFKAQLPHFNFSYRPAAEAFREMFRGQSGIGRALTIVADDKRNERDWLREYLAGFDAEVMLDDVLSRARFRGKPLAKVQGGPRTKLLHHVEQVRDMAEQWLYYSSDRIAEPNIQAQRQIVSRIQALMSSSIESLESQKTNNSWRNAVLDIAARSLSRVDSVLSGVSDPLDRGLTTTLALQTHALITSELDPPDVEDARELEALRDQLLGDSHVDIVAAIKTCLARHEYSRALHLVEREDVPEEIAGQVKEAVEHGTSELVANLEEIESDIEDAHLLGLLEGDKTADGEGHIGLSRAALIAQLMDAKKLSGLDGDGSMPDLAKSYEIIRILRGQIDVVRKRNQKILISDLNKTLEALNSGSEEQIRDSKYLSDMSERFEQSGDYIALSELVTQAKEAISKGESVPRESTVSNEHLLRFVELESDIARKWSGPERIAGEISNKKSIAGVHFGDKDTQHCERAAAALKGWVDLRSWQHGANGSRKIVESTLAVLRLLGVPVDSNAVSTIKPRIVNDFARLQIPVLGRGFDSPLPAFGSEISSAINVVLVRSKVPAREVSKFLESEVPSGASSLVFHVPPIRPTDRKGLRSISIDRKISALLIDFSMLLYAAGTRDPMLTLFDLGLPFCWSSPYIMKGEKVAKEMFVGRDDETNEVLNRDGTSIIFGGRQLGKSALLRHVQSEYHDPSSGLSIIYLDIDDLGNAPQEHGEMVKRLWRSISRELDHVGFIDSKLLPQQNRKDYVDSVQSEIRKKLDKDENSRLIVLLDEADDLLDLDSVHDFQLIKQIRQLMVSTDRRFKVVFAGLQSVQRYTNYPNHPFAQLGEGTAITPLPPMAAWRLVVQPMRALGFEFEDSGLILRVLSQTNYHPGLVQIFCKRLLDRLYSKNFGDTTAPRTIERHDVTAVIRQPEFMDDIRNRFDWTLDLDDRYKVLIYALVLSGDSAEFREDLQFLRLGEEWWPTVFEGMNRQTIRGLLDEMVGLGVLFSDVENEVKVYRLRSPNLLRLLGSRSEIEAELARLISRDKPRKPNPGNYRVCLQKQPAEFGPLTMEQSNKLLDTSLRNNQPFQIRVVLGGAAMGISRVPAQIRYEFERLAEYGESWREVRLSASAEATGIERISDTLKEKMKPTARAHLYTIMECSSIPGLDSPIDVIEVLQEKLQKKVCTKISRGLVILLIDEDLTWEWIKDDRHRDVTEDGRVQELSLQRWGDGSLARALEEGGLRTGAKNRGEMIFKATDGLFSLGEAVICAMQVDGKADWSSDDLDRLVDSTTEDGHLFENISNSQLLESVEVLADIAEGEELEWSLAMDWLVEFGNPTDDVTDRGGEKFRQWLVATGISSPIQDGSMKLTKHFRVDPAS